MGEIDRGIHRRRTSLPLNLYTPVFGCGCSFGFEQKFWRIHGFGEKKARIGGFTHPYSPRPESLSIRFSCAIPSTFSQLLNNLFNQAPVVQRLDIAIHRINRYPVDNY